MSLSVIVTRTLPDARDTCDRLAGLGFTPILSPMLHLVFHSLFPSLFEGVAHAIFTSANGVRAAGQSSFAPALTAWCVGPSTAEAARRAGFGHVVEGDGNAGDLAALILDAHPQGPLLHVANEDAAGALVTALQTAGLDARFCSPYRTVPEPSLSAEALAALNGPGPTLLLVHSAKAAAAVAASAPDLTRAALVAISAPARAPLENRAGLGSWTASHPNESNLLDTLRNASAKLHG